tara:strand:+ start:10575 stop:11030 length:456 start_codon:yes stop_codon:yes gene_type:complete
MFSDKKPKESETPGTGQNRINDGTKLKGNITSNGYFRIDGEIEGNIKTPSKVVIGKTGVVIGTLICENADIEGKVKGILDIKGTLSLRATANIEGEVVTGKLAVEPGATFNATCLMKGSKKELLTAKDETPSPISLNQQQSSKITNQQSES